MIITKSWLNEWVDLSDKSVDDICQTLNQIGLEVDSTQSFRSLEGIIVGFVLSCEKHPEADKLSVIFFIHSCNRHTCCFTLQLIHLALILYNNLHQKTDLIL